MTPRARKRPFCYAETKNFRKVFIKNKHKKQMGYFQKTLNKYALHVYLADEDGVVDGYVSLKRIVKKPLEAELESGAAYAIDLPVAQTKVIWKKNAARGEAPAETESDEPNASIEDENVSALPLGEDEISALPLDEDETADRPVADEGSETTDALTPTPVVIWPEPGEATPGEISREGGEDEIALPILEDGERPVADGEGTEGAQTPAEIIEWPEEPLNVVVLVADEQQPVYDGATVTFIAQVTNGREGETYTFQWQRSEDGENWEDIGGATQPVYEEIITPANAGNMWRAVVSRVSSEQEDEQA